MPQSSVVSDEEVEEARTTYRSMAPTSPISPLGTIGKLPLEVRNMVYGFVFAAGQTALARTSKDLHADTETALFQYGVLKVDLEFKAYVQIWSWTYLEAPSPALLARIRNLQVNIKNASGQMSSARAILSAPQSAVSVTPPTSLDAVATTLEAPRLGAILRRFMDPVENPRHCTFVFRLGGGPALHEYALCDHGGLWLAVRRFKNVVFKLRKGPIRGHGHCVIARADICNAIDQIILKEKHDPRNRVANVTQSTPYCSENGVCVMGSITSSRRVYHD